MLLVCCAPYSPPMRLPWAVSLSATVWSLPSDDASTASFGEGWLGMGSLRCLHIASISTDE